MSTFTQIKTNIRSNLNDAGVTFFTAQDLIDSTQDAYDSCVALSWCLVKTVTLNWQNDLSYYDFVSLGVSDYLATVAIFDNVSNRWLCDDENTKTLDLLRNDWELWHGQPQGWLPINFQYIAIYPKQAIATGTFVLYYVALPPIIVDGDVPLIANDKQVLIELDATADLLEQAEEFTKASTYWQEYFMNFEEYIERTRNLAKADLLRIR